MADFVIGCIAFALVVGLLAVGELILKAINKRKVPRG